MCRAQERYKDTLKLQIQYSEMASRSTRSRRPHPQHPEQQSRAKWTTFLTKTLADLMVDQVHKGNKRRSSFSKKVWESICEEFHNRTGVKWEKEQLKNRHSTLRKQYLTLKSLLDHSDFSWDEPTGTIKAENEAWSKYIEEHPDAESLRSTGCPIYRELCTIFSETVMNGKHNQPPERQKSAACPPLCPEPLNVVHEDSSSESEEANECQTPAPNTAATRKRGRGGVDDAIAAAILEMASASKLRAAAISQRNAKFSLTNCVRELDQMLGIDQSLYFGALDLFGNAVARETFLSLKGDRRLAWLHGKCAAPPPSVG